MSFSRNAVPENERACFLHPSHPKSMNLPGTGQLHRSHSYLSCAPSSRISRKRADTINRTSRDENLTWCCSCLSLLCPTRYAIDVVDLSHDCFSIQIKTRKIRRNKIRLHDWSVKEHQERGSDLIK